MQLIGAPDVASCSATLLQYWSWSHFCKLIIVVKRVSQGISCKCRNGKILIARMNDECTICWPHHKRWCCRTKIFQAAYWNLEATLLSHCISPRHLSDLQTQTQSVPNWTSSLKRQERCRKSRRRDGESLGAGLCPGSPSLSGSQPSATAAAWL